MPLHLTPELERRVTELARETRRDPEAVLAELVGAALDEDEAFRTEVREGLAELDRGDVVPHEQVMAGLRTIIERHGGPRTQ